MSKLFDLDAAKCGAAVQTSDGRAVRILCFDRKNAVYPIIGLVESGLGGEDMGYWDENGFYTSNDSHELNLIMACTKHSRTEWVNVYPGFSTGHSTKHEADEHAIGGRLACIQRTIEWES